MKSDDYDRRTRMTPLGRGIEQVVGRLDPTGGKAKVQSGAAAAWREVAGSAASAHAVAVYIRGRELVVEMDSAAWATDISFLAEQYREAVNSHLHDDVVDTVRIAVARRGRYR